MNEICLAKVTKSYGSTTILENLDLEIPKRQILCIVGPSGAGKTTILNLLSRACKPGQGEIENLEDREISYVFQKPRLLPWLTLEDNVRFVLQDRHTPKEASNRARHWLDQVELGEAKSLYPGQTSGGMEQRAALARAFAVSADLLLMDEPFKGLDEPLKIRMLSLVYELWSQRPHALVFVTHDIREALLLGHQVLVLKQKPARIIERRTIDIPHAERHIGCPRIAELEEHIYGIIDNLAVHDQRCHPRRCNGRARCVFNRQEM